MNRSTKTFVLSRLTVLPSAALFVVLCVLSATLVHAEEAKEKAPDGVVELDKFVVSEKPFGWLGIKTATIHFGVKAIVGMKAVQWVRLDAFEPGSLAEHAGIMKGDYVATLDGKPVTAYSAGQLKVFGRELEAGRRIVVEIYRPSTKEDKTITLVVTKSSPPAAKKSSE